MGHKKKFLISKYICGELPLSLDEISNRFLGVVHRRHTKIILDKNFKHVHFAMDRKSKEFGGRHRIYGHSIKFLKDEFNNKDDISAGYIHLLGDFISDILPYILKNVFNNIKKKNILPPQFINKGKYSWDIKEDAIDKMVEKFGKVYIDTLKIQKNRRTKYSER